MFIKYRLSHHSSRSSLSMMCRSSHSPCIPTISKSEPEGTGHLFERDHVEWRPFPLRVIKINKCCKIGQITKFRLAHKWRSKFFLSARRDPEFFCVFRSDRRTERARSIQPKFQPVRPGKEDHLKRWTRFCETFPVGPNRSIEF